MKNFGKKFEEVRMKILQIFQRKLKGCEKNPEKQLVTIDFFFIWYLYFDQNFQDILRRF